jgi:hypothetical protein
MGRGRESGPPFWALLLLVLCALGLLWHFAEMMFK